ERPVGGGDQLGVVRQTEVIIGAEIQHRAVIAHADLRPLRRRDDTLGFVEAGGLDFSELLVKVLSHAAKHSVAPGITLAETRQWHTGIMEKWNIGTVEY